MFSHLNFSPDSAGCTVQAAVPSQRSGTLGSRCDHGDQQTRMVMMYHTYTSVCAADR